MESVGGEEQLEPSQRFEHAANHDNDTNLAAQMHPISMGRMVAPRVQREDIFEVCGSRSRTYSKWCFVRSKILGQRHSPLKAESQVDGVEIVERRRKELDRVPVVSMICVHKSQILKRLW